MEPRVEPTPFVNRLRARMCSAWPSGRVGLARVPREPAWRRTAWVMAAAVLVAVPISVTLSRTQSFTATQTLRRVPAPPFGAPSPQETQRLFEDRTFRYYATPAAR